MVSSEGSRQESATSALRPVLWPLGGMLLMQTMSSAVLLAVPVLAPALAEATGFDARLIGLYSSLQFLAAMFISAGVGTLIVRYGGVRMTQAGILFSSLAMCVAASGVPGLIMASAAMVGIGYGPNTPAGSHVLARVTPPRLRPLVFSIKQSGAPLGGVLAGLLLPFIAVTAGWRWALIATGALAAAAGLAVQPLRARCDADRRPQQRLSLGGFLLAMRLVAGHRDLRVMSLTSFSYAALQACVFSYVVTFFVQEVGLDLLSAGFAFSVIQVCGAVARIGWGAIAERLVSSRLLLALIGTVSAISVAVLALAEASWTLPVLMAVCAITGATVAGWNGVFLAEVTRIVPAGQVGAATGGAIFFTYFGLVVGPATFSLLLAAWGYAAGFLAAAAFAAACAVLLLASLRRRSPLAGS